MALDVSYAITVGRLPARALSLLRFSGREGISRLHRFEVLVASCLPEPLLRAVALGQRARLALRVGEQRRVIRGVIARIARDGADAGGLRDAQRYSLTLVPRAWLLRKRRGSHIFQDKRVDEVIDAVAARLRVHTRWALDKPLPSRPYCTQFEETDFDLLCRLCAENGLWFRFDHGHEHDELLDIALAAAAQALPPLPLAELGELLPLAAGEHDETLVFSDHASYPPIVDVVDALRGHLPTLHYQDAAGALTGRHEDYVVEARLTDAVTPTAAVFREYDFLRPLAALESRSGDRPSPGSERRGGVASASLGGALSVLDDLGVDDALGAELDDLEIYEHDGDDLYPDWSRKAEEPKLILAQHQRRRRLLEGRSHACRLEPGRSFHLEGHPLHEANAAYAVVDVHHEGVATFHATEKAEPYHNRFTCVPRDVVYVPARPPRRSVQVCLTAQVVGPEGEEIHVNERGEIKVKFHWDRRDERHEPTCWIRTMHPWAGAGWGFQFIPRVGMEAVVMFEGGDPDKPLVVGCVYNGVLPPPFRLPGYKTQSGIVTRSTPRSTGHNALMFDDAAGRELVFLRAERDQHNLVQRDRRLDVNHQDHTEVADDQHLRVGGEQHIAVHGDRHVELLSSDTEHVRGARHVQVDELLEERVRSRSVHVAEGERRVVGSTHTIVHGNMVTLAKGNVTLQVGQTEAPKGATLNVEGSATVSAMESISLEADRDITLRVGRSFVRIGEHGIQLSASSVTLGGSNAQICAADGEIRLTADERLQGVADTVVLKASGAALGLRSEASVEGARVLLNSPGQASDSIETSEREPMRLEVVDQDGSPIPYERFIITLDGGGEHMGYLDDRGKAVVDLSGPGRVTFPDLNDVEEG